MNLNYLLVFGIILFLRFNGENNDLYTGLGLIVIFFIMRNITEGIVDGEGDVRDEHSGRDSAYTEGDILGFLTDLNPSGYKISPSELLNSGVIELNDFNDFNVGDERFYEITAKIDTNFKNILDIYSYVIPQVSSEEEPADYLEFIKIIQSSKMNTFNNNDFYKSYIIGIIDELTSDSNTELGATLMLSISKLDLKDNFFTELSSNIKRGNIDSELNYVFNKLFGIERLKHAFDMNGFVDIYYFVVKSMFFYYDNFFGPASDDTRSISDKYYNILNGIERHTETHILDICNGNEITSSDLRCRNYKNCLNYHCPSGSSIRSSPESIMRGENPNQTCCEASPQQQPRTCADFRCPSGTSLIDSPESISSPTTQTCCENIYTYMSVNSEEPPGTCADLRCPSGTSLIDSPESISSPSAQNCCQISVDPSRLQPSEPPVEPGQPSDICEKIVCTHGDKKVDDLSNIPSPTYDECCENVCSSPLNYFSGPSPNCRCDPSPDKGHFVPETRVGLDAFDGYLCFEGTLAYLKLIGAGLLGLIVCLIVIVIIVWLAKKAYKSWRGEESHSDTSSDSAGDILRSKPHPKLNRRQQMSTTTPVEQGIGKAGQWGEF